MKNVRNWLNRCPAFLKSLWFQLAISYTLLAFCALTLLIIILYGLDDYQDFNRTITPEVVEMRVAGERLTVAQAILEAGKAKWWDKARNNLREKLVNIESGGSGSMYRITSSSRPEVFIQVVGQDGSLLMSDPAELPEQVSAVFEARQKVASKERRVTRLEKDGHMWVDIPITGDDGVRLGRLRILYIAEFDFWVQIRSVTDFLLMAWPSLFLCSVPIGIACGMLASRYVTRQLHRMNKVTERWRQGDFDARIALPSDDVLTRHSRHLNDMAQDLEMYLVLKQNLAVGDERNRVARELHDTVKQKLFALGLQLAAAKVRPTVMEAAGEQILEAEAITREAQHDLMEIITQLRPAGDNYSLGERIGMLADDFRRRFAVEIELNHSGLAGASAQVDHHVLRIVQESLMNAVRHGKATIIAVAGRVEGNKAILTVVDNGRGFDVEAKMEGFGITSMRDRTHDLPQGTFKIISNEGVGTRITISWKTHHDG